MLVLQNSNPVLCFLQILFCRCPSFFLVWNKKHTLTLKIFFSLQIIPSKIYPCTSLQPTRQTKNMREKILGCFLLGPNATQCVAERNARLRIAHCQTEVDETGQSYYGGSRLAFMCLGWFGGEFPTIFLGLLVSLDWLLVSKHVYVVKPGLFVIVEAGWG